MAASAASQRGVERGCGVSRSSARTVGRRRSGARGARPRARCAAAVSYAARARNRSRSCRCVCRAAGQLLSRAYRGPASHCDPQAATADCAALGCPVRGAARIGGAARADQPRALPARLSGTMPRDSGGSAVRSCRDDHRCAVGARCEHTRGIGITVARAGLPGPLERRGGDSGGARRRRGEADAELRPQASPASEEDV